MTNYIVWNENKTANFITTDKQLAYEVRKGAESNCYDKNGTFNKESLDFCENWWSDDCTIELK